MGRGWHWLWWTLSLLACRVAADDVVQNLYSEGDFESANSWQTLDGHLSCSTVTPGGEHGSVLECSRSNTDTLDVGYQGCASLNIAETTPLRLITDIKASLSDEETLNAAGAWWGFQVDLTLDDNTSHFGFLWPFEVRDDWYTKELDLHFDQPVKSLCVSLIIRELEGTFDVDNIQVGNAVVRPRVAPKSGNNFKVDMKHLVISHHPDASQEPKLFMAEYALQSMDIPYEILHLRDINGDWTNADLTLESPGGDGLYIAVIFLESQGHLSLTQSQKVALEAYERNFGVRRVVLSATPGIEPYTLYETSLGYAAGFTTDSLDLSLAGSAPEEFTSAFVDDLTVDTNGGTCVLAQITLAARVTEVLSYYETGTDTYDGAAAIVQQVIDGREQFSYFFSMTSESFDDSFLPSVLFNSAWIMWSSRWVTTGFRRVHFNPTVDLLFLSQNGWDHGTDAADGPSHRAVAGDLDNLDSFQTDISGRLPSGSDIKFNLGISGSGITPDEDNDALFQGAMGHYDSFYWYSSLYTPEDVDVIDAATAETEINSNIAKKDLLYDSNNEDTWSTEGYAPPTDGLGFDNSLALTKFDELLLTYGLQPYDGMIGSGSQITYPSSEYWSYDPEVSSVAENGFDGMMFVHRFDPQVGERSATETEFVDWFNEESPSLGFTLWGIDTASSPMTMDEIMDKLGEAAAGSLISFRHDPWKFTQANILTLTWTDVLDVLEAATGDYSIMTLFVEYTVFHYNKYVTFPMTSLKLDDVASKMAARVDRVDCDAVSSIQFIQNGLPVAQSITIETAGATTCEVPLTGYDFSGQDSVEVEEYGPDMTSWVTVPGTSSKTVVPLHGMTWFGGNPTRIRNPWIQLDQLHAADADFPVTITISFSEDVSDFTIVDLTVAGASTSNFQTIAADTYSVDLDTPTTSPITVDIAAGALTFIDSGDTNFAAARATLLTDLDVPTVTLTTASASTSTYPIEVTATFSEAVQGLSLDSFTVANAGKSVVTEVSDVEYTVNIYPPDAATVSVTLIAGGAQDSYGNENTVSNQLDITYTVASDPPQPTLAFTTDAPLPSTDATIPVTATFSENVAGFILDDVVVFGGSKSNFVAVSGSVYTFDITPSDLTVTVELVNGQAHVDGDEATTNLVAPRLQWSHDTTEPTVSITTSLGTKTSVSPLIFTACFSEVVTGFSLDEISVTDDTVAITKLVEQHPLDNPSCAGSSFFFFAEPPIDGLLAVTVSVDADAAQDAAGNLNTISPTYTVTYDGVRPACSITSEGGEGEDIVYIFTWNKEVQAFGPGAITLDNASPGTFEWSGPLEYRLGVIPSDVNVIVSASIAEGVVDDFYGNTNVEVAEVEVSTTLPGPEVTFTTSTWSYNNVSPLPITATFDAAVEGLVLEDFVVVNGVASHFTVVSESVYTFNVTPDEDDITVSISLPADVATDVSNGSGNFASGELLLHYDNIAPTVTLSMGLAERNSEKTVTVTAEFDEDIGESFGLDDIQASGATVSTGTLNTVEDGVKFTFQVTISSSFIQVSLQVKHQTTLDLSGNLNIISDELIWIHDEGPCGDAGCEHSCTPRVGEDPEFICECDDGWVLGDDDLSCEDLNECDEAFNHGGCSDFCVNLDGGYECRCLSDRHLVEGSDLLCEDDVVEDSGSGEDSAEVVDVDDVEDGDGEIVYEIEEPPAGVWSLSLEGVTIPNTDCVNVPHCPSAPLAGGVTITLHGDFFEGGILVGSPITVVTFGYISDPSPFNQESCSLATLKSATELTCLLNQGQGGNYVFEVTVGSNTNYAGFDNIRFSYTQPEIVKVRMKSDGINFAECPDPRHCKDVPTGGAETLRSMMVHVEKFPFSAALRDDAVVMFDPLRSGVEHICTDPQKGGTSLEVQITCTVAIGSGTNLMIKITAGGQNGQSNDPFSNTFLMSYSSPVLSALSIGANDNGAVCGTSSHCDGLPRGGGTVLTLSGVNFDTNGVTVEFVSESSVLVCETDGQVVSSTLVECAVPPGVGEDFLVLVSNTAGRQYATPTSTTYTVSYEAFTITSVSQAAAVGGIVTIMGEGFTSSLDDADEWSEQIQVDFPPVACWKPRLTALAQFECRVPRLPDDGTGTLVYHGGVKIGGVEVPASLTYEARDDSVQWQEPQLINPSSFTKSTTRRRTRSRLLQMDSDGNVKVAHLREEIGPHLDAVRVRRILQNEVVITEDGSKQFYVGLSLPVPPASGTVNVPISILNSEQARVVEPVDETIIFTSTDYTDARVVVEAVDDDISDGDSTVTILIGPALTADPKYSNFMNRVEIVVQDDDEPGIEYELVANVFAEAEVDSNIPSPGLSVVLSSRPLSVVFVDVIVCAWDDEALLDMEVPPPSTSECQGIETVTTLLFSASLWNTHQYVFLSETVGEALTLRITADSTSVDEDFAGIAYAATAVLLSPASEDPASIPTPPRLITTEGGDPTYLIILPPRAWVPLDESELSHWVVFSKTSDDSILEIVAKPTQMVLTRLQPARFSVVGINDLEYDELTTASLQLSTVSFLGADHSITTPNPDFPEQVDLLLAIDNFEQQSNFNMNLPDSFDTTEDGASQVLSFTLVKQPVNATSVRIPISVSDQSEATLSHTEVVFETASGAAWWSTPVSVEVKGKRDSLVDGSVPYFVEFGASESNDPDFDGVTLGAIRFTNHDNATFSRNPRIHCVVPSNETDTLVFAVTYFDLDGGNVLVNGFADTDIVETSPGDLSDTSAGALYRCGHELSALCPDFDHPDIEFRTGKRTAVYREDLTVKFGFSAAIMNSDLQTSVGIFCLCGEYFDIPTGYCRACPETAECPMQAAFDSESPGGSMICPKQGYTLSSDFTEVIACQPPETERCIGTSCASYLVSVDGQAAGMAWVDGPPCGPGYEGDACAKCDETHRIACGNCVPCNGSIESIAVRVFGAFFYLGVAYSLWFAKDNTINIIFRYLLGLQLSALIGEVTDLCSCSVFVKEAFRYWSVILIDFSAFNYGCLKSWVQIYMWNVVWVLLYVLFVVLGMWMKFLYRRKKLDKKLSQINSGDAQWDYVNEQLELALRQLESFKNESKWRSIRTVVMAISLAYTKLLILVYQTFDCTIVGGKLLLTRQQSVECFAGEHLGIVIASSIGLIGLLAMPFVWIKYARKHWNSLHTESWMLVSFGFLYKDLQAAAEGTKKVPLISLHALLIAALGSLTLFTASNSSTIHIALALAVATVFVAAVLILKPFLHVLDSVLTLVSIIVFVLACIIHFLCKTSGECGLCLGSLVLTAAYTIAWTMWNIHIYRRQNRTEGGDKDTETLKEKGKKSWVENGDGEEVWTPVPSPNVGALDQSSLPQVSPIHGEHKDEVMNLLDEIQQKMSRNDDLYVDDDSDNSSSESSDEELGKGIRHKQRLRSRHLGSGSISMEEPEEESDGEAEENTKKKKKKKKEKEEEDDSDKESDDDEDDGDAKGTALKGRGMLRNRRKRLGASKSSGSVELPEENDDDDVGGDDHDDQGDMKLAKKHLKGKSLLTPGTVPEETARSPNSLRNRLRRGVGGSKLNPENHTPIEHSDTESDVSEWEPVQTLETDGHVYTSVIKRAPAQLVHQDSESMDSLLKLVESDKESGDDSEKERKDEAKEDSEKGDGKKESVSTHDIEVRIDKSKGSDSSSDEEDQDEAQPKKGAIKRGGGLRRKGSSSSVSSSGSGGGTPISSRKKLLVGRKAHSSTPTLGAVTGSPSPAKSEPEPEPQPEPEPKAEDPVPVKADAKLGDSAPVFASKAVVKRGSKLKRAKTTTAHSAPTSPETPKKLDFLKPAETEDIDTPTVDKRSKIGWGGGEADVLAEAKVAEAEEAPKPEPEVKVAPKKPAKVVRAVKKPAAPPVKVVESESEESGSSEYETDTAASSSYETVTESESEAEEERAPAKKVSSSKPAGPVAAKKTARVVRRATKK